ncbi:hypothetical protein DFP73DRAFT_551715 [Morchella snyderi]|nr:hypothetical protein DFP73DRAFT_551715 [Morchella snyderi]
MSSNRFSVLEDKVGDPTSFSNSERSWPRRHYTRPSQFKWSAIKAYLEENVDVYRELQVFRGEGWKSEEADTFFKNRQVAADSANLQMQKGFYNMMIKIAAQINDATHAFSPENCQSVLDLCIAPGGFADFALRQNFRCVVDGTSLPVSQGGHQMLLRTQGRSNVAITYTNITMHTIFLPAGASIPEDSPDRDEFRKNRPLPKLWSYGLVICDGNRLRSHEHGMVRKWEPMRLTLSQLILGLTHVRPGGSMIVLLHGADHWDTVGMMYRFSKFSDIHLFKPKAAHRNRSSFYLVANNIKPELAAPWVEHLKDCWYRSTFHGEAGLGEAVDIDEDLDVEVVLKEFGEKLIEMGTELWRIQKEALESWDWSGNLTWSSPGGTKEGGFVNKGQLTGGMAVLAVKRNAAAV